MNIKQALARYGYGYGEFISPNKNNRSSQSIQALVIHTVESPESSDMAEGIARNWFGTTAAKSSAHFVGDDNSVVLCVPENMTAWTAPGMNDHGLNYEMAGRAAQGAAGWADAFSQKAMKVAAIVFACWSINYDIPVRRLTPAQLVAGQKGICGHVDVNSAFHKSDHTDPGPTFPWSQFLSLINQYRNELSGQPTVAETSALAIDPAKVLPLVTDGQMGAMTTVALQSALKVTSDGKIGPVTIRAIQRWAGSAQDGEWGKNTTSAIQKKLGVPVDGNFNPQTIKALQVALNNKKVS